MGKWVYQLDDNEYVCRNDPPFHECDDCHANKAPYCFGWCTDGGTADSENYCAACCERRGLDISTLPIPTAEELAVEPEVRDYRLHSWLEVLDPQEVFKQFNEGTLLLDLIEGEGKTLSSGVKGGMGRVRSLCDEYVQLKECTDGR